MRVSTYCVTSWLPLHVTRTPGYFGFDRPAGAATGGVPDLGIAGLDAGSVFPAAEVLIGEELDARRRVGLLGKLTRSGKPRKRTLIKKLGSDGLIPGRVQRKRTA